MKPQTMFKGMLLSQGYVATLRALREIAPEALPGRADGTGEGAAASTAPASRGAGYGRSVASGSDDANEIDLAGAMPWQLAFSRRAPRSARACCR